MDWMDLLGGFGEMGTEGRSSHARGHGAMNGIRLSPALEAQLRSRPEDRPFSEVPPNEQGYFDHRDHIADPALYEREDAPIVILNAETGERHPFWSEIDIHPNAIAAGEQLRFV